MKAALHEIRKRSRTDDSPTSEPGCAFGLVIEERVRAQEKLAERVEAKINGLIFAVLLTALVEIGRAVLQ